MAEVGRPASAAAADSQPSGGQRSLRAWQRHGREENLLEALRHRRNLRVGLVQFLYVLAGTGLGLVLPTFTTGLTIERAVVAPMLFGAAGGFISFIALVFSLLFLVVQYGNTTVSPRFTLFRDDRMVWHSFGYFAAVFAYCATAGLRTGIEGHEVTFLVPAVGVLLLLVALALSRALQLRALRQLQFNPIMEEVRGRGEMVLTALYRNPFSTDEFADEGPPPVRQVRWERPTALLRLVDLPGLVTEAERLDALIEVLVAPGQEVRRGLVVAVVRADHPVESDHQVLASLSTGTDRDFAQDPLLAFRLLNDICNRALSLGVNDPATCVQGLGCIYDLLAKVADKQLQLGPIRDTMGRPRVSLPFPSWEDFLAVGLDEVAHYSSHDPTVQARLRDLLRDLLVLAPPARQAAVRTRLEAAQVRGTLTSEPPSRVSR